MVTAEGHRRAEEQVAAVLLLPRASVPAPGLVAGVGVVHAEAGEDRQAAAPGAVDVDLHQLVAVGDHLVEEQVQELVGVGRLAPPDLLDGPPVDVGRLVLLQRMAVDVPGDGVRLPLGDVVAEDLGVRAAAPGDVVVDAG